MLLKYAEGLTKKLKLEFLAVVSLVALLSLLLFHSYSLKQNDKGDHFLLQDMNWYTLAIKNKDKSEVTSFTADTLGQLKGIKKVKIARIARKFIKAHFDSERLFHAIYIDDLTLIKDAPKNIPQQAALISEILSNKESAFLTKSLGFIRIKDIEYSVAGVIKDLNPVHSPSGINIALNINQLKQVNTNKDTIFPDEVVIVGIPLHHDKDQLLKDINRVVSRSSNQAKTIDLIPGVYFSDQERNVKKELILFSEKNTPVILICMLLLIATLAQAIAKEWHHDAKILLNIGMDKRQAASFLLLFSAFVFLQYFFSLFIVAQVSNILLEQLYTVTGTTRSIEDSLNFQLRLIKFSVLTSSAITLLQIALTLIFYKLNNLISHAQYRLIQGKYALSLLSVVLIASFTLYTLYSEFEFDRQLINKIKLLYQDDIIVLELDNTNMRLDNAGEKVFGSPIKPLIDKLEALKHSNDLDSYAISGMLPLFAGGLFSSYAVSNSQNKLVIYSNKIHGDYFRILSNRPELDQQIARLKPFVEFVGNNELVKHLRAMGKKHHLLLSYFTIDESGNEQDKQHPIKIHKDTSSLSYSGHFSGKSYILYSKANDSTDAKFITLKLNAKSAYSTVNSAISSIPDDLTLQQVHNYSDLVKRDIGEYIFKLLFVSVIFLSALVITFFTINLESRSFFSAFEREIKLLVAMGSNPSFTLQHLLKNLALPLVFCLVFTLCLSFFTQSILLLVMALVLVIAITYSLTCLVVMNIKTYGR